MSGIAPGRDSSQRVNERCSVQITCSASICTDSGTLPSSASICAHSARASSASRVMVKALATSPGVRPVSSCMRSRKVAPMRLTIELVTAVAMISRFRRWLFHRLGVLLLQRLREVAHQFLRQVRIFRHVGVEQLLEQHDLASTTAAPTAPDASGPGRAPCARRARRRLGRNSIWRSSRPCDSSVRMKCCLEPRRDTLIRSIRLIAWFWR